MIKELTPPYILDGRELDGIIEGGNWINVSPTAEDVLEYRDAMRRTLLSAASRDIYISFYIEYSMDWAMSREARLALFEMLSTASVILTDSRSMDEIFGATRDAERGLRAIYKRFGLTGAGLSDEGAYFNGESCSYIKAD